MTEHEHNTDTDMTKLTAKIVSAYVSKNAVPVGELPALIRSTYAALSVLNALAWSLRSSFGLELSGLEAGRKGTASEPEVPDAKRSADPLLRAAGRARQLHRLQDLQDAKAPSRGSWATP